MIIPVIIVIKDEKNCTENQLKSTDATFLLKTPLTGKYPNICAITRTVLNDLCRFSSGF